MHITITNPRSFVSAHHLKTDMMRELSRVTVRSYEEPTVTIVVTTCYAESKAILYGTPSFVDETWVRAWLRGFNLSPDEVEISSLRRVPGEPISASEAFRASFAGRQPVYGSGGGGSGSAPTTDRVSGRIVQIPDSPEVEALNRIEALLTKLLGHAERSEKLTEGKRYGNGT